MILNDSKYAFTKIRTKKFIKGILIGLLSNYYSLKFRIACWNDRAIKPQFDNNWT